MPDDPRALIIVDMQNDFVLPGAPGSVAGAYATLPRFVWRWRAGARSRDRCLLLRFRGGMPF